MQLCARPAGEWRDRMIESNRAPGAVCAAMRAPNSQTNKHKHWTEGRCGSCPSRGFGRRRKARAAETRCRDRETSSRRRFGIGVDTQSTGEARATLRCSSHLDSINGSRRQANRLDCQGNTKVDSTFTNTHTRATHTSHTHEVREETAAELKMKLTGHLPVYFKPSLGRDGRI